MNRVLSVIKHGPLNGAPCRFHNPAEEPELNRDIVPYLDDNVQLSIEEYRDKLYEVHLLQ